MEKDKIVLALDQSTSATGWALFLNGKLDDYGIVKPTGLREKRIHETKLWLENKSKEIFSKSKKGSEITLVLEDIYLEDRGNVKTFKVLAHLQGVLIDVGYKETLEKRIGESVIHGASAWKSTCGIAGRTRKDQKANAHKHVLKKYGLDVEEDICDAICLGEHHIHGENSEINFE